MEIPEWMETPSELVGKTIAAIEPYAAEHYRRHEGHVEGEGEADAWKITFTDGTVRVLMASYDDSAVHWAAWPR